MLVHLLRVQCFRFFILSFFPRRRGRSEIDGQLCCSGLSPSASCFFFSSFGLSSSSSSLSFFVYFFVSSFFVSDALVTKGAERDGWFPPLSAFCLSFLPRIFFFLSFFLSFFFLLCQLPFQFCFPSFLLSSSSWVIIFSPSSLSFFLSCLLSFFLLLFCLLRTRLSCFDCLLLERD